MYVHLEKKYIFFLAFSFLCQLNLIYHTLNSILYQFLICGFLKIAGCKLESQSYINRINYKFYLILDHLDSVRRTLATKYFTDILFYVFHVLRDLLSSKKEKWVWLDSIPKCITSSGFLFVYFFYPEFLHFSKI